MEKRIIDDKFINELREFLYRAQKYGYGGNVKPHDGVDGTHTLSYTDRRSGLSLSDTWYGGEPFRGITVIRCKGIVCWVMTYGGEVFPGVDKKAVYACLRPALVARNHVSPWRGPEVYIAENGMRYVNEWHGDIKKFSGEEIIYEKGGTRLYECKYEGGFVDRR